MSLDKGKKVALVTGASGFIGFHISIKLLKKGWRVIGLDSMSDYYDVSLKESREKQLFKYNSYRSVHSKLETPNILDTLFKEEKPKIIIHLAAQAGVRYSIENPRSYLNSNIFGTFELLEACKLYKPKHLLISSTSSVYGANQNIPFEENNNSDKPMSFYAASKKSTEIMAHSYSHIYKIPTTVFRFFTVYGPWGRPDMAIFKFTKAILNDEKINIYNYGDMERDFTYIEDLVESIIKLINSKPSTKSKLNLETSKFDTVSSVAPYRIINLGNSNPVKLLDFVKAIENTIGKKAKTNLIPIQAGDVPKTWADTKLLNSLVNKTSDTTIEEGIKKFVEWFRNYYQV